MSLKQTEKPFLYLILLSILLHVGTFYAISLFSQPEQLHEETTTMVDLQDLPEPPSSVKQKLTEPTPKPVPQPSRPIPAIAVPKLKTPMRPPEKALPQARKEAAPKVENQTERIVESKSAANLPEKSETQAARPLGETDPTLSRPGKAAKESLRGEEIQRPGKQENLARLFPSARSLARIEESSRKKYLEAEKGDTRLMDTEDPDIGGFTRRFSISLWERLNSIERSRLVGLGKTVLNIRFRRDGTIEDISVLYSTGNKALDRLAIEASRKVDYVGPLPKKWQYDRYNMICGFTVEEGFATTGWEMTMPLR